MRKLPTLHPFSKKINVYLVQICSVVTFIEERYAVGVRGTGILDPLDANVAEEGDLHELFQEIYMLFCEI